MGDVQGPEKVNDTCMKTMHAGTMDRGFTLYLFPYFFHLSFSAVFRVFYVFFGLQFSILASPCGNSFIFQKFAVCHFFCTSGIWDFHLLPAVGVVT